MLLLLPPQLLVATCQEPHSANKWVHEFAFQTPEPKLLLSANIGSNSEGLAHVSQEQLGFLMPDLDGRHVCLAVLGQQHD